jgi:hypothetical protein
MNPIANIVPVMIEIEQDRIFIFINNSFVPKNVQTLWKRLPEQNPAWFKLALLLNYRATKIIVNMQFFEKSFPGLFGLSVA